MNQMLRRMMTWAGVLVTAAIILSSFLTPAGAGPYNPCDKPGNLTANCGFNTFVDRDWNGKTIKVPDGWWHFVLEGSPDFRPAEDTYWGAPSLWLLSDGVPFCAGVYQQVNVTPGVVYQADVGWAAADRDNFERKVGLDPTGGTNPGAPSVVWSRSEWGIGTTDSKFADLLVSARATGPRMTVFVWVRHASVVGVDSIFIDAVGLWPDPSQPAQTATFTPSPVPPTPTRRPPTRTPAPAAATDAPTVAPDTPTPAPPTALPTDTPAPTNTPLPTDTPTATSTPSNTPTPAPPTATPRPSRTPLPTVVPVAMLGAAMSAAGDAAADTADRAGAIPLAAEEAPPGGGNPVLLYVAVAALAAVALLVTGGGVFWLRKTRVKEER